MFSIYLQIHTSLRTKHPTQPTMRWRRLPGSQIHPHRRHCSVMIPVGCCAHSSIRCEVLRRRLYARWVQTPWRLQALIAKSSYRENLLGGGKLQSTSKYSRYSTDQIPLCIHTQVYRWWWSDSCPVDRLSMFEVFDGGIVHSWVFIRVNAASQDDVDTRYNADFPDARWCRPMMASSAYRSVLRRSSGFSFITFSRALLTYKIGRIAAVAKLPSL
jgi:hypothetical protein